MTEERINEIREETEELLKKKDFSAVKRSLIDLPAPDAAILIGEMPIESAAAVFRLLPKDQAAEVLVELSAERQEKLIAAFSDRELKPILDELFVDDMADLVEEMPAGVVKKILKVADAETRAEINQLLKYPKDSAGSIMTTEFVDLKKDLTVREAFQRIRETGPDKETVYTCYVIDPSRRLLGVVTVKELLFADQESTIESVMETNVVSVRTDEDKEEVAHTFDKYDFLALPVTDHEGRLVGIVTVDDAMDVLQEENTEDFEKMAAINPSEKGYFETSVFAHAKNRILWLLVLMVSATLTGMILNHYEAAFVSVPILVAMIPMLMDTGGNCGSQSSTMVIRGLALGEMRPKMFFRVWLREIRIAAIVGAALAVVNFGRVYLFYFSNPNVLKVAIVTSVTLVFVVLLAKTLGTLLPMLAKVVHLDPAIMAAPLITTTVDACSVLLFFAIASRVFDLSA